MFWLNKSFSRQQIFKQVFRVEILHHLIFIIVGKKKKKKLEIIMKILHQMSLRYFDEATISFSPD